MGSSSGGSARDWVKWHDGYNRSDSPLAGRLAFVQSQIERAFDDRPPGPIGVLSICAGEGRDLLAVLEHHGRAHDVTGRLVELDPTLAARARSRAPSAIDVLCADAGLSESYAGVVPADLVLCCGVFGHLDDADIRSAIDAWRVLAAPGATVIWTRGDSAPDLRETIRGWVTSAGFTELAFAGAPETWGVGVARWPGPTHRFDPGVRYFSFGSRKR